MRISLQQIPIVTITKNGLLIRHFVITGGCRLDGDLLLDLRLSTLAVRRHRRPHEAALHGVRASNRVSERGACGEFFSPRDWLVANATGL